jgi:hypothetical protein
MPDTLLQFMDSSARKILVRLRMVWVAMLFGQAVFLLVAALILEGDATYHTFPDVGEIIFPVSLAMLVTMVPLGYFLRSQTYKKNWVGRVVTPIGYFNGNLALFVMCEAVSMTGLVGVLLQRVFWPMVLPSVLVMAVQVINFPTGSAMRLANQG